MNGKFFVMVKDKCCLICNASASLPKEGNLERVIFTDIFALSEVTTMGGLDHWQF
jgi:hypothetical protein